MAFSVGCPICNKLVVAALGASGTASIWAPIQPALGAASVLGLAWALRRRLQNASACLVEGRVRVRNGPAPAVSRPGGSTTTSA